jgi:hypothetical protein
MNEDDDLPVSDTAYREYQFDLNGEHGSIALTLGDQRSDDPIATFARDQVQAVRFGMINVLGISDGPSRPIFWAETATQLTMMPADDDPNPSPHLQQIITEHLQQFLGEIDRVLH